MKFFWYVIIFCGFCGNLSIAFDYDTYVQKGLSADYKIYSRGASQDKKGVIFFLNDLHNRPESYLKPLSNEREKKAIVDRIIFDVLTTGVGFGFSGRSATPAEKDVVTAILKNPLSPKSKFSVDPMASFYMSLKEKVALINDQSPDFATYMPQIQAHRQALKDILNSRKNQTRLYPEKFTLKNQRTLGEFQEFLKTNHGKGSLNTDYFWARGLDKKYSDNENYIKLVEELLIQELRKIEEDKDTLIFYNGTSSSVYFLREVWSAAYRAKTKKAHFISNRLDKEVSPDDFLKDHLETRLHFYNLKNRTPEDTRNRFKEMKEKNLGALFWDHIPEVSQNLMSASILILDPTGAESAFSVFANNKTYSDISEVLEIRLENIISETLAKMGYKDSTHLAKELTKLYMTKYKDLPPQLLQIFVKKDDFDKVGYYCIAGGDPIMTSGSGNVLYAIERSSLPQGSEDFRIWKVITDATDPIIEWDNTCKPGQCFYRYLTREAMGKQQCIAGTNFFARFLQVRFLATNPLFSNPDLVKFITYYADNKSRKKAQDLRKDLKATFDAAN